MSNQKPTEKLALIEEELIALIDKPSRSREELRRIPELENQVELLRAQIQREQIREMMADPAYMAKIKAMPPMKPLAD